MAWADAHGLAARLQLPNIGTGPEPFSPERLPLVICGPILRRTEPEAVTVWVVLKKPGTVTLRVYSRAPPPFPTSLREELQGTRETVPLGANLHVVAVTARPVEASRVLDRETVYFYNLFFGLPGGAVVLETAEQLNSPDVVFLAGSLDELEPTGLSYSIEHKLPSFSLPPEDLNKLRIIHGSCRKATGGRQDALALLDDLISLDFPVADERPHLLLLSGDQIYADDVAQTLLFLLMDASDALLGWSQPEALPGVTSEESVLPGKRTEVVEDVAKFTSDDTKNHLLRLGEYYAIYLFAWSDALFPKEYPEFREVFPIDPNAPPPEQEPGRVDPDLLSYRGDIESLTKFHKTLRQVRRALANVPTYMIFDDHEITDDWNMARKWCEQVFGSRLGRRVIQNGLLSFAVFQSWGNTPDRFEAGQPGEHLLAAAAAWSQSQGGDAAQEQQISDLVGMPGFINAAGEAAAIFQNVNGFDQLSRPVGALLWHYTITWPEFEIVVTDSRTQRAFTQDKLAPPSLLGPAAMDEQIPVDALGSDKLLMVVVSTNLFTNPIIFDRERTWNLLVFIMRLIIRIKGFFNPFFSDKGDSWDAQGFAFESMLSSIARRAAVFGGSRTSRVLLLSGDVHHSFAARMQYWAEHPFGAPSTSSEPAETIFAHLTSSSLKKETKETNWLHRWGYVPASDRLPKTERWVGWGVSGLPTLAEATVALVSDWYHHEPKKLRQNPPTLAIKEEFLPGIPLPTPDWRYRLDFLMGQKTNINFTLDLLEDPDPADHERWLKVFHELHSKHKSYAQEWGDGVEIVGKNNIAELRLQWEGLTTLVSGIGESDDSFRVADPSVLPPAPLLVTIESEVVEIGGVDRGTGECTKVVRGRHKTAAAAHPAGAAVEVFKAAVQVNWWRLTEEAAMKPLTRFVVPLTLVDQQFPKPLLPGETP